MPRGRPGPRTTMVRVSLDLDDLLGQMSVELTKRMGRLVTKTEASQILAASQSPTVLVKKRRREPIQIGGSLVWV